jgi:hypothetical protein
MTYESKGIGPHFKLENSDCCTLGVLGHNS